MAMRLDPQISHQTFEDVSACLLSPALLNHDVRSHQSQRLIIDCIARIGGLGQDMNNGSRIRPLFPHTSREIRLSCENESSEVHPLTKVRHELDLFPQGQPRSLHKGCLIEMTIGIDDWIDEAQRIASSTAIVLPSPWGPRTPLRGHPISAVPRFAAEWALHFGRVGARSRS